MTIKKLFNDHDVRPWWILLVVMVGVLVCVQQVGAYVITFQNPSDMDDWSGGSRAASTYLDTFVLAAYSVSAYYDVSYPTNYWAYTQIGYPNYNAVFKNVTKGSIMSYLDQASTSQHRYEFERTGSGTPHIHVYRDGVYYADAGACANVPYYISFYRSGSFYIDNVVIGTSEEHNVISCPPQTWFVAKDVFDSGFSGLYDVVDHQVYTDTMHCQYALPRVSGGSATVTVADIGTGLVVNTTTISGSYSGVITYNLTSMLFISGAPYGQYRVAISGSSASDTFWYKAIATGGTSIQWDDTDYEDGDEATITFAISESNWDTDDYSYRVEVWDESLNELTGWAITSRPVNATKTVDIDTDLFPLTGTYYAVLTATDLSSSEEMLLVYDDAYVTMPGSGEVIVSGTTYDAITNLTLTNCTVTATQLGSTQSTTSDGTTGAYEISGLVTDWSIGMNASKTNYTGYLVSFMPYEGGTYGVDIPLVPSGGPAPGSSSNATTGYYNSTTDGTAIGGLCWEGPYWTISEGCNVTVSNSTWTSDVCTTGAGGWYQCNNIGAGGSYTLTCCKSGYTNYTVSCTLAEGCFNREDCTLDASNTLTVNLKDTDSLALLVGTEVTVSLDTGESTTTDTGTCSFSDLEYGSYVVTGAALGYYPGSTGVVMDAAKTVDVFLTNSEGRGEGAGAAYAPKSVKFSVQTLWGRAISECNVTCCGFETTAGSWSWLYDIFGLDYNETPIATSTMTGFTDDRGSINFLMLEPVQYECTFVKTGEINKTLDLYPKDDYYLVISTDFGNTSWLEGGVDINAAINCTVTTAKVNSTAAYVNFTYRDSTNATTGGTVFLNQTNATPGGLPVTISTCALSAGCSSGCNCSFLVTGGYAGESYLINCCPNHTMWDFTRSFSVTFPPEQVNPLGLSDTELMLIAMFFVIFTGCLFGAISAPHAPLAMSFMGILMWALGWMDAMGTTAIASLVLATVLSVLFLVMVRSKKERWV